MRETLWLGHLHVAAENRKAGVIGRRSLYRWCNESFPLLYPPTGEPVLELDGCGVDMLGIINESVFLVAYTYCSPTTPKIPSSSTTSLSTLERATSSTSIASLASGAGTSTATTPLSEVDISKLVFNSTVSLTHTANCAITRPDDEASEEKELRVYLSRRAKWKSAWPSLLDCTAAGGLSSSDLSPLEGMIREAHEEVRLPSPFLRSHAKLIGENRLMLTETEIGEEGCQMQLQHCFEVELPEGVVPRPGEGDGEVAGWELVTVPEMKERMRMGEVKPASGLVLMRWMLERGLLTDEEGKGVGERLGREWVVE
ncbi:uncharacterized protein PODANS_5_10970 [Podospora anserina S mat+]|uniref:Podospora anserina S mat+ genomic DNA chromosome 5, supercontig 10 n=1 Tax=Podospora anserina (strain S / ATCC MYA-4624 / DSM 980 / FGSC 10383) TaxID=515849 RepID=B2APR4_PODAN|nr:uncharacterized protein PODANS_5_10970 [Podospora anserina S mat+]CAP65893.1 unnamed protein product [Podospora anserina S mat+]CDP30244.1 Putative thiamine pyrophosphokinase [Podospora anserina S mat+]